MHIDIYSQPLQFDLYGLAAVASYMDYAWAAFKCSDRMWEIVRSEKLQHKGINIGVYEEGHQVFAGVELTADPGNTRLARRNIVLKKYARYRHVGPYNGIGPAGNLMRAQLKK